MSSAVITVTPIDDKVVEGPETVAVALAPNTTYTVVATGNATVTIADNDSGKLATVTANPTSLVVGGTVTATWSGINPPSSTDYIGIYSIGAPNAPFLSDRWIYVSCSQTAGKQPRASGSCGFVLRSSVTPGTYHLRLFSSSGSLLATSNAFTVQ